MRSILRHVRTALLASGAVVFIGIGFFLVSLALPIQVWRTGELPTVPIPVEPGRPFSITPIRVWIDTDAACGQDRRTDPDDCLAILLLAQEDGVEVVVQRSRSDQCLLSQRFRRSAVHRRRLTFILFHYGHQSASRLIAIA